MDAMDEKIARLREKSMKLPQSPGVYLMKNRTGTIIYVGKAKRLKHRVSSYFTRIDRHEVKVLQMVRSAEDFDFIVTASEFEALVLECSLIKLHMPKYNILLKDDKGYSYIKISPGPFPRITAELQKQPEKGARFLGPYMSSFTARQTAEAASLAFRLRSCSRVFPRDLKKGRPCLEHHIGRCRGICTGRVSEEEYKEALSGALSIIKSGAGAVIKQFEEEMAASAEREDFEKAAEIRDRITAIKKAYDKQTVLTTGGDRDVFAFLPGTRGVQTAALMLRGGVLADKSDFTLDPMNELPALRSSFLAGYYSAGRDIPPVVVVDGSVEGADAVQQYLEELRQGSVKLVEKPSGENLRLSQMARDNALGQMSVTQSRSTGLLTALEELRSALGLKNPPEWIEAFDISNHGTSEMVGGMVVFNGGEPKKSAYKRFKIKNQIMPDDYAAMAQVVRRRLTRLSGDDGNNDWKHMPDLILLDGGSGHVSAVRRVLNEMTIDIPLFGIVKDSKHRSRAIASEGGEIAIKPGSAAFRLLAEISEEVHRFAITYHRNKKAAGMKRLALEKIPGIGAARAAALLKAFGSLSALKKATAEQIAKVKGISKNLASEIIKALADD